MKLAGKVALITGANRGIGRGCALEMAQEGADIVVHYRGHKEEADAVAAEVESLGRRAITAQADIANRDQIEAMIAAAFDHFGKVDILINNAVSSVRKRFIDLTVEDVAYTWGSALWGPFHCSQVLVRHWIENDQRGKIVMISSVHAFIPFAGAMPYNTAKAGLNHMAHTMAAELTKHHINVNVIEPGWTDTPGERQYATEDVLREEGQKLPWGRMGTSEEIGKAAVYLCSDDADYITGATLRVDGGFWLPRRVVAT